MNTSLHKLSLQEIKDLKENSRVLIEYENVISKLRIRAGMSVTTNSSTRFFLRNKKHFLKFRWHYDADTHKPHTLSGIGHSKFKLNIYVTKVSKYEFINMS